jgi:uncharacterized membrane protein YphA (DoxX/SURF4 family)
MGRIVRYAGREFLAYLGRISQAWNKFWFTPRDPFALCVMRLLVGWMAFYTTFVWGIEAESFLFPHGYNSAEFVSEYLREWEGPYALSFWFYVPVDWIYPVHYLCLAITFCFMIGLFTRTTSILSLIIVISYAYRARFSNYGLDQILAILTLYLCIAPSGAYLSVDRLLRRYRSLSKNLKQGLSAVPEQPAPSIAATIATRFTQLHYCVIYLAAGTGKLQGDSWWDGSAMWRSLANAEYQTLDLTWLAYFPWFTEFMTHLTIAWEISFAFLIWRPLTRPVVMFLGLGMHFGIGLMMGMWTFGTCMMFGYLMFVEPQTVRAFFHFIKELVWRNRAMETVQVDPDDEQSVQQAAWRKALDCGDRLHIELGPEAGDHDGQQEESTIVTTPRERFSLSQRETGQGLTARLPGDASATQKETDRSAPTRVLLLDINSASAAKTAELLQAGGKQVELAATMKDLLHRLEQQDGPHIGCELIEFAGNSAQYVVVVILRGHHIHGPHSGPYEKFTA